MDFIRLTEKGVGREAEKRFEPMQKGDLEKTWAVIDRARDELDFSPKVSLEDGLGPLQARLTALTGIPLEEQIPTTKPSIKSETKISEYEAGLIREFYADDFERFGYDPESWRELAA